MKKTLLLATSILFLFAAVAQQTGLRSVETSSSLIKEQVSNTSNATRAIVYVEGFENTSNKALPDGWTCEYNNPNITSCPWISISNDEDLDGIATEKPIQAYAGTRSMARSLVLYRKYMGIY